MATTKFTPGPWHVRGSMRELDGEPTAFPIDASQTCCVADVWADDEQAEANANLIAAAPEMYERLYRLLETVSCTCTFPSDDCCPVSAARAALAKAVR